MTALAEVVSVRQEAEELRAQALALLEKGEFPGALSLYDGALERARLTEDPSFVDWIFVCRAAAAVELGGGVDGELVELKRILLRASDPGTAFRAAYTSAGIYELRRDLKRSLFYNRIAGERAAQLGDPLLVTSAENQRGNVLVVDSRFPEAAQAYESALAACAPPVPISRTFRAITQDNLGYCLLATDQISRGLELVHEALSVLEAEGAAAFTALPLLDLCFGYLKADRFIEARFFGEEGLQRAASAADPDSSLEKNFFYLLGEACHLAGDQDGARGYFDRLAALYPEFKNLRAYLEVFDFRNVINLRV